MTQSIIQKQPNSSSMQGNGIFVKSPTWSQTNRAWFPVTTYKANSERDTHEQAATSCDRSKILAELLKGGNAVFGDVYLQSLAAKDKCWKQSLFII